VEENTSNVYWFIEKSSRFVLKEFEEESLLYDKLSGSTHLVDNVSAFILSVLDSSSKSTGQLCEELASMAPDLAPNQVNFMVKSHLVSLESQGFLSKTELSDSFSS